MAEQGMGEIKKNKLLTAERTGDCGEPFSPLSWGDMSHNEKGSVFNDVYMWH